MSEFKIPKAEFDSVMGGFWFMLRECEERAFSENDPVMKHYVAGLYGTWNRVTGKDLKPRWDK